MLETLSTLCSKNLSNFAQYIVFAIDNIRQCWYNILRGNPPLALSYAFSHRVPPLDGGG